MGGALRPRLSPSWRATPLLSHGTATLRSARSSAGDLQQLCPFPLRPGRVAHGATRRSSEMPAPDKWRMSSSTVSSDHVICSTRAPNTSPVGRREAHLAGKQPAPAAWISPDGERVPPLRGLVDFVAIGVAAG